MVVSNYCDALTITPMVVYREIIPSPAGALIAANLICTDVYTSSISCVALIDICCRQWEVLIRDTMYVHNLTIACVVVSIQTITNITSTEIAPRCVVADLYAS